MIEIDPAEVWFTFSPASGPGGQHVNRSHTRVTLCFDVASSASLDERGKRLVFEKLAGRISKEGLLRVVSQKHRSQEGNRRAALERFHELLAAALARPKPRKPTRTTFAAKQRRLESKRQRAQVKRGRGSAGDDA